MKKHILYFLIVITALGQMNQLNAQYRTYPAPVLRDYDARDGAGLGPRDHVPVVDRYGRPRCCESGNEFNFTLTFGNFSILNQLNSQIVAARRARKKVDEWLKKQEKAFLREINRQMGKNYSSFSTAQREYFKFFESRGGRYGPVTTAHRLEGGHWSRASQQKRKFESHTMEILILDRWRACGYCSRYDEVEVQGNLLGEIQRNENFHYSLHRRSAIDDFGKSYYQNALADSEARGMDKLIENGALLNRLSGYRVNHYRRLGLQDKVFQMSAYLILTGAIRTNYLQYPLPSSLRKYSPPKYWNDDRLLKWGKDLAPAIPHERFIFSEEYLQRQINYWTRIPIVRISKQKVIQKVERERQEVVEELLKKMKKWYLDLDGDGYHSKIHIGEENPGNKWKTTTKGLDCDDFNPSEATNCDKQKNCVERTGLLHNANFSDRAPSLGYHNTIKEDNFRNSSWGVIHEANCRTGRIPKGAIVEVISPPIRRKIGSRTLNYYKVKFLDCPKGNNKGNGNFDRNKPCSDCFKGNPLKKPEVAAQLGISGIRGGMYGMTRFNNGKPWPHEGLDLKNDFGNPIYAMFDGTAAIHEQNGGTKGAGFYVTVTSRIDNKNVQTLYFHMQKERRVTGEVKAGDIIGYQGDSGNLKAAIKRGFAISHLHVKVKENGVVVDPRKYMKSSFGDTTGAATHPSDCY